MALTQFTGDAEIIVDLPDQPNDSGEHPLDADGLKAKFDEFGTTFKTYFNDTHLPEVESAINAAAAGVGSGGFSGAILHDNSVAAEKLMSTSGVEAVSTAVIRAKAVTMEKVADDVKAAINAKQDELTFDNTPTASSTNPVTSGGILTALNAKQPEHITHSADVLASAWDSNHVATVAVQDVTDSNTLIVTPAPASFIKWSNCAIRCTAQTTNQITLTARTTPDATVTVQVLILN